MRWGFRKTGSGGQSDYIRRWYANLFEAGVIDPVKVVRTAAAASRRGGDVGEYRPLHEYLRDRFADRFVLTFRQIEDLLGFPLPEQASVNPEWWGGLDPVVGHSKQSDCWALANRSARVNLTARCVTFEREDTPNA